MNYTFTEKAPTTIRAPDGESISLVPGQQVEISDAFFAKIQAGPKEGSNAAAIAMLEDLVPSSSREARKSREMMEKENRKAHAEAGLPAPPPPPESKKPK